MTDQAAVLQRVVLAKESSHGAAAPAANWRELGSLTLTPSPQISAETFKPTGQLLATVGGVNQEHSQVAIAGRGTYTELPFLLAGLIEDVVPTTPAGAVLARLWTFRLRHAAEQTPATYAAARGTSRRSEEAGYLLVNQGQLQYSRQNGLQISGQALARLLRDNMAAWLTIAGGPPTAGTWDLTLRHTDSPGMRVLTDPIAHNASAATLQAALRALGTIGSAGVTVTGSAGGPYTVTFAGELANRPVPMLVLAENALTGGSSPTVGIAETTPGATPSTPEVQTLTITGTPTGGTYRLRFDTVAVTGLARTISASALQTAIEGLPAIAAGDVAVSGGALGTNPLRVQFGGRYRELPPPVLSVADGFDAGDVALSTLPPIATSYPLVPILGRHFSWRMARTQAALQAAPKLTRALASQHQVQNRWGVFFPMNDDEESFAGHVVTDPTTPFSILVGADQESLQYLADLRRGDKVFVRGLATGPIIEDVGGTVFRYLFQVDLCVQLTNISERRGEQGLVAVEYTGVLAYDATWGTGLEYSVQNTLTSL